MKGQDGFPFFSGNAAGRERANRARLAAVVGRAVQLAPGRPRLTEGGPLRGRDWEDGERIWKRSVYDCSPWRLAFRSSIGSRRRL